MAEADAEHRQIRLDQRADHRYRIDAGGGGIAGAVRQEHAVGLERQDVLGARRRRHHRDLAAAARQLPQDIALDAVIDGDDVEPVGGAPAIALAEHPGRLVPVIALAGGDVGHKIHAFEARPGGGRGPAGRLRRSGPSGACAMTALGMPRSRIRAVSARVSMPAMPMMLRRFSQASRWPSARQFDGSVMSARRTQPAHAGRAREIGRLDVLVIGPDIADVGKGEGDDLAGIGGIGEDLLIGRSWRC